MKQGTPTMPIEELLAETAWVRGLARRLAANENDADDLAQDVWVAALRRPPEAARALRPWLATVLRNRTRDRARDSARHDDRLRASLDLCRGDEGATARAGEGPPDEWLARLELQELVSGLVRELPEREREALLLRFHGGLSSEEIAARTQQAVGTVRWRQKAALDSLRAALDRRYGGDRNAWMSAFALIVPRERVGAAVTGTGSGGVVGALAGVLLVGSLAVAAWTLGPWGGRGPIPGAAGTAVAGSERPALVADSGAPSDGGSQPISARATVGSPAQRTAADVASATDDGEPGLPQTSSPAPMTTIRLRVVDGTGAPVTRAEVEVIPSMDALSAVSAEVEALSPFALASAIAGHTATTDGSGRATLTSTLLRVATTIAVEVEGPDLGHWRGTVAVEPGADVDLGDVALEPRGRVRGTFRDAAGRPVAGWVQVAQAELAGDPSARPLPGPDFDAGSGSTRADGTFEVPALRAGVFRLFGRRSDGLLWEVSEPFEVEFGETVAVDLTLTAGHGDEPPRVIVRDERGEALAADIQFFDEAGASILSMPASNGVLVLHDDLTRRPSLTVAVRDRELRYRPVRREASAPYADLAFALEPATMRTVRLRLRSETGAPIDTFHVQVHDRGWYQHFSAVHAGGGYDVALPFEPGEALDVALRAEGFVILERRGLVVSELPEVWEETLTALPGVTGRVTFEGRPVARPQVNCSHVCSPGEGRVVAGALQGVRWTSGHETRGDRDGRFALPLQWTGHWMLRVSAPGYADALFDLGEYDPAVGRTDLAFELVRPGEVRGTLLDHDGRPLARTRVTASHARHLGRSTTTDDEGRYALTGLAPGAWFIHHGGAAGGSWTYTLNNLPHDWQLETNCEIRSGEVARCDLRLPALHVVRGRMAFGALGRDAGALSVSIDSTAVDPLGTEPSVRGEVDADGRFELRAPRYGNAELCLSGACLAVPVKWSLDVDGGEELALDLPLARVTLLGEPGSRVRLSRAATAAKAVRFEGSVTIRPDGRSRDLLVPAGELVLQTEGGVERTLVLDMGQQLEVDLR